LYGFDERIINNNNNKYTSGVKSHFKRQSSLLLMLASWQRII